MQDAATPPGLVSPPPSPEPGPTAATTPEPTATPVDLSAFPGPDTTGVPDGVELDPLGEDAVREDGRTLERVVVDGDLTIHADGVTLREVRVEGSLLVIGSGVVVEDSELGAMSVSGATDLRVSRVEIFGREGSDGMHITSDRGRVQDVLVEDSWIHSPVVTEDSHYDGIQVRGVDRLVLRGNHIDLGDHLPQYTAAVFLQDANGGNADVLLEGNLLNGGGHTLYLGGTDIRLVDNVLGPDFRYALVYPEADPFEESGTRTADGEPLTLVDEVD